MSWRPLAHKRMNRPVHALSNLLFTITDDLLAKLALRECTRRGCSYECHNEPENQHLEEKKTSKRLPETCPIPLGNEWRRPIVACLEHRESAAKIDKIDQPEPCHRLLVRYRVLLEAYSCPCEPNQLVSDEQDAESSKIDWAHEEGRKKSGYRRNENHRSSKRDEAGEENPLPKRLKLRVGQISALAIEPIVTEVGRQVTVEFPHRE